MGATTGKEPPFPNAAQRLEGLGDADISPDVRKALGPWWPPFNLHRVLAHNPQTLQAWMVFGNHILRNNLLAERLRELVVLRVAWNARSAYEWGQHAGLSRRIGIPEADIARVVRGPRAKGWTPLEAAALSGVDQLMKSQSIDPQTYATLAEHLSPAQLLDYVFLIGEFILVALALNTFQIARDPGLADMPGPADLSGPGAPATGKTREASPSKASPRKAATSKAATGKAATGKAATVKAATVKAATGKAATGKTQTARQPAGQTATARGATTSGKGAKP
jgi:alkylhydroperoxidase family enzyme